MPGKEYRFQVAEQRNFVIVFPTMVSVFLKDARGANITRGKLKLEQILEEPRAEYLLRMINSNRTVYEGFYYRQIQEKPMGRNGLCCLLEEQLGSMKMDGKECFNSIALGATEGMVQAVYSDSFIKASRDLEGEYLYIFADKREEQIFI